MKKYVIIFILLLLTFGGIGVYKFGNEHSNLESSELIACELVEVGNGQAIYKVDSVRYAVDITEDEYDAMVANLDSFKVDHLPAIYFDKGSAEYKEAVSDAAISYNACAIMFILSFGALIYVGLFTKSF